MMPSLIRMPPFALLGLLTLAVLVGCRDTSAPTDSEPGPALAATASAALAFRQVSGGSDYTCGVGTDDQIYCWGINNLGQLGNGATDNTATPVGRASVKSRRR